MKKVLALTMAAALAVSALPMTVLAESNETKSVRIGAPYDPGTYDTAEINTDPATYIDILFTETLLRKKDGAYIGGLADSWTVSDDGLTWTFVLKDGLTYSDGTTPITTEDLEYTVKRLMNPDAGHYNAESGYNIVNGEAYYTGECDWEDVGVKVIDEKTITYTFVNPEYEVNFASASLYAPLEEAFVEPLGAEYGTTADKTLSSGPYVLSDWQVDVSSTLTKNPNYWDADSINMDEIVVVANVSGDTGVDMMLAGELDFVPAGSALHNQTLEDAGFERSTYYTSYRCLNLNHGGKTDASGLFLSNANFRKALSYAIDRTALTSTVMTSDDPANRLVAPSEAGTNGKTFVDEFSYEGWPVQSDAEKAKEYLQAALDELGKTIDDVPVLDLLCYEAQGSIDVLAAVQDMLATNLGIQSQINATTIQVMISSAMTGDYDLWYGGNEISEPDAANAFLQGYYSGMASPLRGYNNEEFDALYKKTIASSTLEERRENFFELEKFFCDNTLNLILGWTSGGFFYKTGYTGFTYTFDTDFTYLDFAE